MTDFLKKTGFLGAVMLFIPSLWAIDPTRLTCETLENPLGIYTQNPRLGWQLRSGQTGDRQTAYQIIVSSSRTGAEQLQGDVWDSGRLDSDENQWVVYEGSELRGGRTYYWRVRAWDAAGNPSAWSGTACWEQAPDPEELNAQWIGAISRADSRLPVGDRGMHTPSPHDKEMNAVWDSVPPIAMRSILLRKPVEITKNIRKAVVHVSGLGHYELSLNGQKIGESRFAPLWSDYDKTVYYNTFRIDNRLTSGENVFGVWLGNGFYNAAGTRYRKLRITFGPPTLFFQAHITYDDGSTDIFYSDSSWKWSESPITHNDIFGGEDYDARLEQPGWDAPGFDDQNWKRAVVQGPPQGELIPQLAPPVKIMETWPVKSVSEPGNDTKVFDMGQNLSGFPTVIVQGKPGQTIRLLPGESLRPDGFIDQRRTGGPHYYEYTIAGDRPEWWTPRFSYYGFQYIQVQGADYDLNGKPVGERPVIRGLISDFIYNSSPAAGTFECSNEIFNRAHHLIVNAIKSNMQAVFTDCPHREKLGWIEQVHLNGPGIYYNFNVSQLIPKVLRDMSDGQHENGLIPSIVPEFTDFMLQTWGADFADSPEWGSAICVVPWQYFEYYGDDSMIRRHYPNMRRYVDYLGTKAENYILSHGLGDWYDYGEHAAGYGRNTPIALSATSHWYLSVLMTVQSARLVGDDEGAETYQALADRIKTAFNREFFNPETRQYATGSQFANAVSIYLELVPEADRTAVLANLVADIRAHGMRLTTGDVGNRYLFRVLADNGLEDVLYEMLNHTDAPGYGFQLAYGLTTLTEQWDPTKGNSQNHFMLGQIEEWLYSYLAGIRSDDHSGFRRIRFSPQVPGDMTYARGSHETLYGTVSAGWKRRGANWEYTVTVPVNCTGVVVLPSGAKGGRINGKSVAGNEIAVGSGTYTVTCRL